MEIKTTCQHVMDKRTDRQTDGQTDRQTDRWMDILSWHSLTLMHLWRTLQGENVCHGAEAPRGIHIIPKIMLDITTISITCRYCLSTAVSFRASKSTKTRRFDVKKLELDPARPHINILHHHSQLLMFVCDFYSYRELV